MVALTRLVYRNLRATETENTETTESIGAAESFFTADRFAPVLGSYLGLVDDSIFVKKSEPLREGSIPINILSMVETIVSSLSCIFFCLYSY